jgi:hypothetical protein
MLNLEIPASPSTNRIHQSTTRFHMIEKKIKENSFGAWGRGKQTLWFARKGKRK